MRRLIAARRRCEISLALSVAARLGRMAPSVPLLPPAAQRRASGTASRPEKLFTPGPLTTSAAVKSCIARDAGSRDEEFLFTVREIRQRLLRIAGASQEAGYECVLVQGAGSMALEAMLGCSVPRAGGKLLIVSNGSYGERQEKICDRLGIPFVAARHPWDAALGAEAVEAALEAPQAAGVTHVSMVHHETTAGVLNRVSDVGKMLRTKHPQVTFILDAISSFGAYDVPVRELGVHYFAGSANKCIEGVPGFAFVVAHRQTFLEVEGCARSLVLDLHDQWRFMESTGQFRFTPPCQALLGFRQALDEWDAEGGLEGRAARYRANYTALAKGMSDLGFDFYVADPAARGHIITTFQVPPASADKWDFRRFYDLLKDRGFVIYPASLPPKVGGSAPAFRVGNIGQLFVDDVQAFLRTAEIVLKDMGLPPPLRR